MNWKILFMAFILLIAFTTLVSADFNPDSSINMHEYSVHNATYVNATYFYQDGSSMVSETVLNASMDSKDQVINDSMAVYVLAVNGTMKTYVLAVNGTMKTYVLAVNGTMKTYAQAVNTTMQIWVDAQDIVFNNSVAAWVNGVLASYYTSTQTDTAITNGNTNSSTWWDNENSQANLNVNSSEYWDNLGDPSDINAADITDDGTYLTSWTYSDYINQALNTTDAPEFATINTGIGPVEAYKMDQNVTTTDAPEFATINTGIGNVEAYAMNQNVSTTDAVIFGTVDTGEGANELFNMNQDVESSDAVTFITLDTGQGANELYDMNQNVQTTSDVSFNKVSSSDWDNVTGLTESQLTLYHEKCFTLESPVAADNATIYAPKVAITVTNMNCHVDTGTSAIITISDGTNSLDALTCNTTRTFDDGSIANSGFTAYENMKFTVGTVTGTVDWVNYCIIYTVN